MNEYIGTVGSKISLEVTYTKRSSYTTTFGYRYIDNNVFRLEDASGNCIIWKTTSWIEDKKFVDEDGICKVINEGAKLLLTATVKEHSEYKGIKQTVISRPRFTLVELGKTPAQIAAEKEAEAEAKRNAQYASLKGKDEIWHMPYRQYKEHYSDCETLYGSYSKEHSTIGVIIRDGRLKPSGTRGGHYSGYEFTSPEGCKTVYRAISEETARKRLQKDFGDAAKWECTKIYRYDSYRIW